MALVEDKELRELRSRRDTAYSMLKELEFDYHSGILTEEDYRDLEEKYKTKALAILSELDATTTGTEAEDEIEKHVQKLRRGKVQPRPQVSPKRKQGTTTEAQVEREVLKLRQQKGHFCTQCGARYEEDDRFCSKCGASLKRGRQN
ncbi:MAG: zinc ribbon domain-containing protein [Chloroflexi bacterium]|nr:zinc ribbon domain-containing protein [Chloroflexota bacterium]